MSLQYLKKQVRYEVDFLHADKHQSFLQVYFNILDIKISYKVILSLFMGMIKYSQRTQSKSLQYLKKEVKDGIHFLYPDKYKSFCKMALLSLMEVARHVQSTQNSCYLLFMKLLN